MAGLPDAPHVDRRGTSRRPGLRQCLRRRNGQAPHAPPDTAVRRPEPPPADFPDEKHAHQARSQTGAVPPGCLLVVRKRRIRRAALGRSAPLPSRRFTAAAKMQEDGWPIRFRLDPMIPYQDDGETCEMATPGPSNGSTTSLPRWSRLGHSEPVRWAWRRRRKERPTYRPFRLPIGERPFGLQVPPPVRAAGRIYRFVIDRLDRKRSFLPCARRTCRCGRRSG